MMRTDYYERIINMLAERPMTTHEITLALFPDVRDSRRISHLKSAMAGRLKHWTDTGYIRRQRIAKRNPELILTMEWLYFTEGKE